MAGKDLILSIEKSDCLSSSSKNEQKRRQVARVHLKVKPKTGSYFMDMSFNEDRYKGEGYRNQKEDKREKAANRSNTEKERSGQSTVERGRVERGRKEAKEGVSLLEFSLLAGLEEIIESIKISPVWLASKKLLATRMTVRGRSSRLEKLLDNFLPQPLRDHVLLISTVSRQVGQQYRQVRSTIENT